MLGVGCDGEGVAEWFGFGWTSLKSTATASVGTDFCLHDLVGKRSVNSVVRAYK